jgi:integrase
MASFTKIGKSWRVRIRRAGFPPVTKTFTTKARAQEWAMTTEVQLNKGELTDREMIADVTVGDLIKRYCDELTKKKPFGKNKTAVLKTLKLTFDETLVANLTDDRLAAYVKTRYTGGASGVTIAIDLTYLKSVLKAAKQIWKLPVNPAVIDDARAQMRYLDISTKSVERKRRPTADELAKIKEYFRAKGGRQQIPMWDVIDFAVASAMRQGEIVGILWQDVNEADRTVIIRDRKHPREKVGNDQEVPLLGDAFDIVKRQKRIEGEDRIFPYSGHTISSIFPRACRELKIVGLRFHDLRHEGVSRLFGQGYTIEQVALVSGHRDWKMLSRYTHIKAKDLHRPTSF